MHFQLSSSDRGVSRCCSLPEYNTAQVVKLAWNAIDRYCSPEHWLVTGLAVYNGVMLHVGRSAVGVVQLSLSASKFSDCLSQSLYTFICNSGEQSSEDRTTVEGTGGRAPSKRSCQDHNSGIVKRQRIEPSAVAPVNEVKSDLGPHPLRDEQRLVRDGYPNEVLEMCCECAAKVPVWLMREHIDHHLAVKLQKQEQLRSSSGRVTGCRTLTIDTFFQKK